MFFIPFNRHMQDFPHYLCPLCQSVFTQQLNSWQCPNNHNFDMAKQGYINLLPPQFKKSKNPGDDKKMVTTRTHFLNKGFYEPLAKQIVAEVTQLKPKKTHLLDIGCGEGYYTQHITPMFERTTAIDISKHAVHATARRKLPRTQTMVASANKLPLAESCVDVAVSIFSPILTNEVARVLTDKGFFIIAKPQEKHLIQLRNVLFDEVTLHNSDKFIEELAEHFSLEKTQAVNFDMHLPQEDIINLLTMTPYAYRAKPEKRTFAENLEKITVSAAFKIYLFKKK